MPGTHFGEVEFRPVESGLFRASPGCSGLVFWVSLGQSSLTWNLQPTGCIICSGLLIQMRVVLQGVSGGALQEVR